MALDAWKANRSDRLHLPSLVAVPSEADSEFWQNSSAGRSQRVEALNIQFMALKKRVNPSIDAPMATLRLAKPDGTWGDTILSPFVFFVMEFVSPLFVFVFPSVLTPFVELLKSGLHIFSIDQSE
jgi:hypothetical protein